MDDVADLPEESGEEKETYDLPEVMERVVKEVAPELFGGAAIPTGWYLVIEAVDEDGDLVLGQMVREGQPWWRSQGLLSAVLGQIVAETHAEYVLSPYDEDEGE